MKNILLVDGYNIIGAWPELRVLKEKDLSAARDRIIEILAEYKRCGISAIEILKGMLLFNPVFLIKEIVRRKISAGKDISKCFALAKASGLIRTAGTKQFPIFVLH